MAWKSFGPDGFVNRKVKPQGGIYTDPVRVQKGPRGYPNQGIDLKTQELFFTIYLPFGVRSIKKRPMMIVILIGEGDIIEGFF